MVMPSPSSAEPLVRASDGAALPLMNPRLFGQVDLVTTAAAVDGGAIILSEDGLEALDPNRLHEVRRALARNRGESMPARRPLEVVPRSPAWRAVLIGAFAVVAAGAGLVIGLLA